MGVLTRDECVTDERLPYAGTPGRGQDGVPALTRVHSPEGELPFVPSMREGDLFGLPLNETGGVSAAGPGE